MVTNEMYRYAFTVAEATGNNVNCIKNNEEKRSYSAPLNSEFTSTATEAGSLARVYCYTATGNGWVEAVANTTLTEHTAFITPAAEPASN